MLLVFPWFFLHRSPALDVFSFCRFVCVCVCVCLPAYDVFALAKVLDGECIKCVVCVGLDCAAGNARFVSKNRFDTRNKLRDWIEAASAYTECLIIYRLCVR